METQVLSRCYTCGEPGSGSDTRLCTLVTPVSHNHWFLCQHCGEKLVIAVDTLLSPRGVVREANHSETPNS